MRSELERFGGTVEKFIGDAVMAVFGAPVAHEDDPERAVRAALTILETLAEDGDLEIRIGITTGEALIALDARPESGEGMASGDVVNTAARLQSGAPTGAILVDETTYRATERTHRPRRRRSSARRRATGAETGAFDNRARVAFREAGERSFALHAFRRAAEFFERSLELSDEPDPTLLLRCGRALVVAGDVRGVETLETAADALLATGDREGAAEAHAFLTEALHLQSRGEAAYGHMERALGLVRETPPSAAKVRVLTEASRLLALGEGAEAGTIAQEGYDMATALGLTGLASRALTNRGIAKVHVFDLAGSAADLELAIELARSVSSPEEARARHNLGSTTWFSGELGPATAHFAEAARVAERFGYLQFALASRSVLCGTLYPTGAWTEASTLGGRTDRRPRKHRGELLRVPPPDRPRAHCARARRHRAGARGREEGGRGRPRSGRPQVLVPVLSQLAFVAEELGLHDEAQNTAQEFAALVEATLSPGNIHRAIDIAWVAGRLDCVEPLRRLVFTAPEEYVWHRVVRAILDADFERAAGVLAELGHVDEGYARLRAGEQHLAERRAAEADAHLRDAIAFFRPLGATAYVHQAEELLVGAGLEIPA